MHMLRNCVDHGIESADVRQRLDKPEQATIRINCSRQGSRFVLHLSDDGSGLDYDAIRSRGIALYPESGVEQMDNNGLAALIFKQGFSVRDKVTTMSGRGVGMDVVRDAIEQLNGFIEVQSIPGGGTDFTLSMPIIVAQLPALMVMFGKQQFAVPMRDVNTVLRLSAEEMSKDSFEFENEQLPLLWPVNILGLRHSADSTSAGSRLQNNPIAFVVDTGGQRGVLMADAVLGQKDIIFKNLGSHLQNIPYVAGATILGDGSLVPILQTEDMFRRSEMLVQADDTTPLAKKNEEKRLEILIVDDSISVRKVLTNFVRSHDWHATVASDGVVAMEKIREQKPDLVLLDIEMPRMNGFEVLQAMQSQSVYRNVPVLMLTSRSAVKYRDKATELGASGFVTKPYKDDELFSLIRGLTDHKIAERDLQ
jgi:chemosensory pili system protein ChpA (sensor histidine kinase/response regulator)